MRLAEKDKKATEELEQNGVKYSGGWCLEKDTVKLVVKSDVMRDGSAQTMGGKEESKEIRRRKQEKNDRVWLRNRDRKMGWTYRLSVCPVGHAGHR